MRQRIAWLTFAFLLLSGVTSAVAPTPASGARGCVGINIYPGQGLARRINGASGKTFCLHAGRYWPQKTIRPGHNVKIIGPPVRVEWPGRIHAVTRIVGRHRTGVIDMGEANNVVLQNLDISGARGFKSDRWRESKLHGRGIRGGDNVTIRYVASHHNAAAGISSLGPGALLDHVELYRNGSRSYVGCCAGGVKSANFYTIRNSYVHHNIGNGIWVDVGGSFVVSRNVVVDNSRNGIRYENSRGFATIVHNRVQRNSTSRARPGGGIEVNSADDALVAYNVLGGNFQAGITFRGNRRPVGGVARSNIKRSDPVRGCDLPSVTCLRNR